VPQTLKLTTLGGLDVRVGNRPVSGLGSKAAALLVYLAGTRRPHSREVLAELLWDERESAQARTNLRVVLNRWPKALVPHLLVTRETVAFDRSLPFQFDLDEFERHLHAAWEPGQETLTPQAKTHLEAAVSLYGGAFLAGFSLPGAVGFESWLAAEQERVQRQVTVALHSLVSAHLSGGDYAPGVQGASRLLDLDPLDEEAHRQRMRLLAAQGQRGAALSQHALWTRRLDEELGAEPEAQTVALAEHIRAGELAVSVRPQTPGSPAPALPRPPTGFIGRATELSELTAMLSDPACQLLTVIGLGGSGKTRVALEVAGRLQFPDGVFFVPLVGVAAPEGLAGAVANALGWVAGGWTGDWDALMARLRDQQALLVLDNFEHLSAGAALLSQLLQAAPGIKLLVTSREALHLHAEWLYDLGGLTLPVSDSAADLANSAAVRLFVQSARRVQARFELTETNAQEVAQICRLVEGSPLGIELAAAWVRVQECALIAREIEHNLDFLTSPLRDVPERHRSLRAVFEHSWRRLLPPEQEAFRRLSVFRGGFGAEAAREVAGVTAPLLAALLDRSLLSRAGGTRYELHELLRQFAEEKWEGSLDEAAVLRARHVAYYEALVGGWLLQPQDSTALESRWAREARESDNIRAAVELELAGTWSGEAAYVPAPSDDYPIRVEVSVLIPRPVEEVFTFAANVNNDAHWLRHSASLEARYTTPGAVGVGTTLERTTLILGRRVTHKEVVIEYLPGRRVGFCSVSAPIRYRAYRIFEPVGGGTRLTCVNEVDIRGWYRLTGGVVTRVVQHVTELDVERLKQLLTSGVAGDLGADALSNKTRARSER
jgi:predicted ATPase/DNA-binding SARP family transcriptional activator/uncharacterized membrane protein